MNAVRINFLLMLKFPYEIILIDWLSFTPYRQYFSHVKADIILISTNINRRYMIINSPIKWNYCLKGIGISGNIPILLSSILVNNNTVYLLIFSDLHTVESLEFVIAHFSWISWIPHIPELHPQRNNKQFFFIEHFFNEKRNCMQHFL